MKGKKMNYGKPKMSSSVGKTPRMKRTQSKVSKGKGKKY